MNNFIVYTTEDNLIRLCSNKENSWLKIINKTGEVVISPNAGKEYWDMNNPLLQALHRGGINIITSPEDKDFIHKIVTTDSSVVMEDPCAAYLLEIDPSKAKEIQTKYGVICQSINDENNVLVKKGWRVDTSDPTTKKTWDYFFSGHNCPLNSLIIVDRYFFSSEQGETINDSLHNLKQILNALLPLKSPDNVIQVIIIFDFSTFRHNRDKKEDGSDYTFKSLAEKINKLKRAMRDYAYSLELLSVNSNCYNYSDTHNRRIIANYSLTIALHKLKAFNQKGESLCSQDITFRRLFEAGIEEGDKSTTPFFTQKNIIDQLIESVRKSKNSMQYAINGKVASIGNFEIQNRLLKKI